MYVVARGKGEVAAHEVVARLDVLPIILHRVDRDLVRTAAALKARHPIACAAVSAAAAAMAMKLPVVTGDLVFAVLEDAVNVLWTTATRRG